MTKSIARVPIRAPERDSHSPDVCAAPSPPACARAANYGSEPEYRPGFESDPSSTPLLRR